MTSASIKFCLALVGHTNRKKKGPETRKLADTGCFPGFIKWPDAYSRIGNDVRETSIWWAWLFTPCPHPIAGSCGNVAGAWEKWFKGFTEEIKSIKGAGRSQGKLKLEEWEEQNIYLLKLSFLVHCSWNSLFYTLNWLRWCRQGLQLSKILPEVTRLGRKHFSLLKILFSSVITVQP